MKIILNASDTDDALDHITDLIISARTEHAELRSRFLTDRDGYPTRSPGNGGSPSSDVDEDGTPLPPRSDSVANLVVSRDEASDPIGTALSILVSDIHLAMRTLEHAIATAANSRPPEAPEPQPADDLWCRSCLRINQCSPVHTKSRSSGLCRWCYDFTAVYGKRPPTEILDRHVRGAKISQADVERALRRPVTKKKATRR